jgi:hypothetical protein
METVTVTGNGAVATQLVAAGDGITLISNSDPANTIYLGDDNSASPSDTSNVIPLAPTQFLVVDGTRDVFAMCIAGQTANVYLIPGGMSFFQLITKLVIEAATPGSGLFVYSGIPNIFDLFLSIAAQTGVDPQGVDYLAGLTIGTIFQTQLNFNQDNLGRGILNFIMNNANFNNGFLVGQLIDPTDASIILQGPQNLNHPDTDYISMQIYSGDSNTGTSAQMSLFYVDDAGSSLAYLFLSWQGALLIGKMTGTVPGTGTSATNKAVAETWHNIPLSGWTVFTGGYVAQYRINGNGNVELRGRITTTGTSSTLSTALPAGYFPSVASGIPQFTCPVSTTILATATAGQTPRIAISNAGILTVAGITVVSGTVISLDGVMFPQSA